MPRKRNKSGKRQVNKKISILCEGAKDKSESAYFKKLKNHYCFASREIEIIIEDTKVNTGRELVSKAIKLIDKAYKDIDEIWVVYDKDGYTQHQEAFRLAKSKNINIAFSSISFEMWILLHFDYTSRPFAKSEDIISYLHKKYKFTYQKNDSEIFSSIKNNIQQAIENAKKLDKFEKENNPNSPLYELNPYTDVYKLIEEILKFQKGIR